MKDDYGRPDVPTTHAHREPQDIEFGETSYRMMTLSPDDYEYPSALNNWPGRRIPGLLYCIGNIGLFRERPLIMICGARDASRRALDQAGNSASQFGEAGIPVISGLARGVDLVAHREVLLAGGSTIAVLPYGINRVRYDETMAGFISEQRMLVTSEFEPSRHFKATHALRRNRVMVALSDAVIVVEPGQTGGTWSSASAAADFGRPLFYIAGDRPECSGKLERMGGRAIEIGKDGAPDLTPVLAAVAGQGMLPGD